MAEIVEFVKSTFDVRPNLRQLSDQVALIHALITWLTVVWALFVGQTWLAGLTVGLWLLALVIWFEFKHGGK